MPRTIHIDKLLRLTLVRRGKATAKHPLLREHVVEAVKATPVAKSSQFETGLGWQTPKATPEVQKASSVDDVTPGLARYASGRYQ